MANKGKKRCEQLPVLHPDAAGIDVGASELYVAVPAGRDTQPVRSFPTFTRDLNALADWLNGVGCDQLRWSQQACTGFRFIRFSRHAGLRCSW